MIQPENKVTCPACSTEAPAGSKFCPECGAKIPPPKPEPEAIPAGLPPVLTVNEVADLLRVSRWMVYELITQQKMPYFVLGRRRRFKTQDVLDWAARQTTITTAG